MLQYSCYVLSKSAYPYIQRLTTYSRRGELLGIVGLRSHGCEERMDLGRVSPLHVMGSRASSAFTRFHNQQHQDVMSGASENQGFQNIPGPYVFA